MRIESTSFTDADYDAIVEGYFERERAQLIERLRKVPDQVDALVPALDTFERSDDAEWNPIETLAHMAIGTQFFGWAIHEVASGKEIGGQMVELMNLRDPSITEAVTNPPASLVDQLRDGVDRLVAFLQDVPYEDLRTRIAFASKQLSAEDFARLSLVHHLEDHLEQMRTGLAR
jgi:DinB superfamily